MKILYVGNYTQAHCTEVHLAATLEALGHEVDRVQENGISQEDLSEKILAGGFDLFLFTRTWGETVTLDHLHSLKQLGIPSASYHLDLYVGLKRDGGIETDPFWRTDFVFTPDGDPASQKVFEEKGIKHYYMKPGVFKRECLSHLRMDGHFEHDVLFVGTGGDPDHPRQYGHPEWPYRGQLIKFLRDTYGDRFAKFGDPDPTIRGLELNVLYGETKVTVGDSLCLGFNKPYYWSDRAYETMGRGGFLIHPYIKGMEEEFEDRTNIVFYNYGDWGQLKFLIDYYVEHDDEREKIRRAGHEFVRDHATYNNRLERMLDIIFGTYKLTDAVAEEFAEHQKEEELKMVETLQSIKINLGCGKEPTEGYVNLDWIDGPGVDVVHNLFKYPWPFKDNSATNIKAIDVLEHMPPDTSIKFIEECHRILQPGGELFMTMPHYESKNLWIDPTHFRGYDEKSFDYFDPDTDFGTWYGYYSQCKFKVSTIRTANDNVEFTLIKREQ